VGTQQCPKLCTYLEDGKGREESTAQLFPTAENLGRGLRTSYSCPGGQRRAEVGMQCQVPTGCSGHISILPMALQRVIPSLCQLSHRLRKSILPPPNSCEAPIPAAGAKCWGRVDLPTAGMSQRAGSWPASLATGDRTARFSLQGTSRPH